MAFFLAALWAALFIFTVGAVCASFQGTGIYSTDPAELARRQRRLFLPDLLTAIVFSLLPPVLLLSPFITGFYVYGWRVWPPKVHHD